MDIQLHELIEKIKKEGIESAQTAAARLKSEAEAEAKKIIESAKREADSIIAAGKADAERSEKAGIAAVEQASRNLVLAFKGEIQGLLDKIAAEAVSSSYSTDVIKGILPDLIKNWASKDTDSLDVILSEGDLKKLDDAFKTRLYSTLRGGVDLKMAKTLDGGFHIAEKDGSAFYDFSAETVAKLLSAYLSPKLAEILKSAAKGI
jgi:V/A-type H+-transporting ATPase subunit E